MKALHTSIIDLFLSYNASFENACEIADAIFENLNGLSIDGIIWEIADYLMNYTTDGNAWIQAKITVLDLVGYQPTPQADLTIARLQNRI